MILLDLGFDTKMYDLIMNIYVMAVVGDPKTERTTFRVSYCII